MQAADLEAVIREKVQDVKTLLVSDVSGGCGQAFDVIIVSPVFQGLPTLKRHRMVNDLLKDQIAQLHAFSQKTYTPAQYEALSGKSTTAAAPASTTAAAAAAASTSEEAAAAAAAPAPSTAAPATPATPSTSLMPSTPPPKTQSSAGASHQRSTSNVSIPELTLTTDDETLSGRSGHGAPRPLTPSAQPGGSTSTSFQFPDMQIHSSPQSPGPSISRLHHSKVTSVEFWEGLRAYLESQLISQSSPSVGADSNNPLASPGPGNNNNKVKGEAELIRLWEDFFQSQKPYLSASDVAKVRDETGMYGMN